MLATSTWYALSESLDPQGRDKCLTKNISTSTFLSSPTLSVAGGLDTINPIWLTGQQGSALATLETELRTQNGGLSEEPPAVPLSVAAATPEDR